MGRLINDVLEPMVQENPYLEFAFDQSQLVGFRVGFEETWGFQGNIIDVISGFIYPDITVDATLFGSIGVGTIELVASLGGVRTIGWLDLKTLVLKGTGGLTGLLDRKSTRLNSSHVRISYAVFCLKKKKKKQ